MSNNIKNKGIRYTREGVVIVITLGILMGIQELNCGVPERTEAKVALGISLSPSFIFICFSLPLVGSFSPSCLLPSLTYLIATITGPSLCDFPPHRVCPAIYIPMRERGNPTGPVPLCRLRDASPSCGQHGCWLLLGLSFSQLGPRAWLCLWAVGTVVWATAASAGTSVGAGRL